MHILKRSFIITFFCIGLLFASNATNSKEYKNALKFYKTGNYQNSYTILKSLLKNNLKDLDINYYFARSAFKLKKYEEAISAYERILINHPKNLRVRLELARSYFKNGNLKYAKKEFETVLKSNPPKNVVKNIKAYLAAIDKAKKRNFINGAIIAGIGYDSNINNRPNDDKYFIPFYNLVINNTVKDDHDWYHQEVLLLNDLYDIGERGEFAVKNSFLILNKTLKEYSSKNLFFVQYSPSILYKEKMYGYEVGLIANKMWYGSEGYIHAFGLNSKFFYKFSKNIFMNTNLNFQRKYYESSKNRNQDSKLYSFSFSPSILTSKNIIFSPIVSFSAERKIRGALTNIDKNKYLCGIGISKKIGKKLKINLNYSYDVVKYREYDPIFKNKREDKENNIRLGLTYLLPKKFILSNSINYLNVNSNQAPNEYNKYKIGINIIKPF